MVTGCSSPPEVPVWYRQSKKLRLKRVTKLVGGTDKPPEIPLRDSGFSFAP